MKKYLKRAASVLIAALLLSSLSCASPKQSESPTKEQGTVSPSDPGRESTSPSDGKTGPDLIPKEADVMKLSFLDPEGHSSYIYGEKGDPDYGSADFTSLYAEYGRDITIADVLEDPDTGLAYIVIKGKRIFLGLDFLARAMIYNCEPAGDYPSEEDAYAAWWQYYVTRWNAVLPEIPLYQEEAVTLYRSEISGPEKVPGTAWRSLSRALLYWSTSKESNTVTVASLEKLRGKYRFPGFDSATFSASDQAVSELTNGLSLVSLTEDGRPVWNETVVHDHEEVLNEDGSVTYTITLWEDLRFSDGSYVTAKDYLAFPMAFFSAPGAKADPGFSAGTELSLEGSDIFGAYEGVEKTPDTVKVFSGLRLLDERRFSLTVPTNALPDANSLAAIRLTAQYAPMWLGESEILDDGEGCYLSEDFYERDDLGDYVSAEHLRKIASEPEASDAYPFSGAYSVIWYSEGGTNNMPSVILLANEYYSGDLNGQKPAIHSIVWKAVAREEIYAQLQNGTVDIFTSLTGPEEIRTAADNAERSGGTILLSRYKTGLSSTLHFRADLGPVQFKEVRQALAHLLDRKALQEVMCAGISDLIDAPCSENALYNKAVRNGMRLRTYAQSTAEAILLLEANGWIYNAQGGAYVSGTRYKKIPKALMDERNLGYTSADGSVKVYERDGYCYMPLAVNFFLLENTLLSETLEGLLKSGVFKEAGMLVTVTEGSYAEAMDELHQRSLSGYYQGTPLHCAFDAYLTDYAAAPEDDSILFSVDPDEYELFSQSFFRDPADVVWLK